ERVRRGRIGLQPLGFEARLEIGAAHRAGELGREPVHDRTRSAFGSEYAEPELRVETSYPGLLERRNLRKRRRPLLPGNRKRPHLAALDVGKRNGEILEGHVHLPTDQVRYRRRRTLVWDVLDIESGNELELLARE